MTNVMVPNLDIRNRVYERVEHYIDIANNVYDMEMEYPIVDFTVRGTTAGTATGDHTVNFNAQLLIDNLEHFMEDTIPHEVAHCVDHYIHGHQYKRTRTGRRQRVSHGATWKRIMRAFGVDPARCHSMDTTKVARPKTKHTYTCSCCGSEVTVGPKIHNKIQRGFTGYGHKGCKGSTLQYKQTLGKVTYKEAAQMKARKPIEFKVAPAPKAKTTVKAGTQIAQAIEIYLARKGAGINGRQDIIKSIMVQMDVDLKKASGLHDRAKKKVGA